MNGRQKLGSESGGSSVHLWVFALRSGQSEGLERLTFEP
jgi:hypothetical protein